MTNERVTILPPEFQGGLLFISGYRGQGKSFLASTADLPQNIAFFDFESKGKGIDRMLRFGTYRALTVEASRGGEVNPLLLFDATMQAVEELEQDRYTVLIMDNVSPFETAVKSEAIRNVDKYCKAFGLSKKNVLAGRFGGTSAVTNYFIAEFCNAIRARGINTIIVTSHISARWAGGVPLVNSYNVKGASKWQELSILSLVLIPGDEPPIPSALVLKEQLGLIEIDIDPKPETLAAMQRGEVGHIITRRLPTRIPLCDFAHLRRYLYQPADIHNPADGEVPTLDEAKPFQQRLDREQIQMVLAEQRRNQQADQEADTALALQTETALSAAAQAATGTPVEVATALSAEFGIDVSPAQVVKWRR